MKHEGDSRGQERHTTKPPTWREPHPAARTARAQQDWRHRAAPSH